MPADRHSFRAGVTTVVDAGSSGWKNFPAFRDRRIRSTGTRILRFLNIAGGGMGPANQQDQQDYDPVASAQMVAANLRSRCEGFAAGRVRQGRDPGERATSVVGADGCSGSI